MYLCRLPSPDKAAGLVPPLTLSVLELLGSPCLGDLCLAWLLSGLSCPLLDARHDILRMRYAD